MRSVVPGAILLLAGCREVALREFKIQRAIETTTTMCWQAPAKVDVLLVIDNSPSMGEEAETLAANLRNFTEIYEGLPGMLKLDYRIAVTTTSITSPQCGNAGADGALIGTTCRERVDDFWIRASHEGPERDLRHLCLDHCPLETLPLTPTVVDGEPGARPHPWIERDAGRHNYPDGVFTSDMLTCMGLVGVAGCTWESPLEAAYRALRRMQDQSDPSFGFLRPDANLFVLFIGDEGDSSVRAEHADVFDPDGDRAFWPEAADEPTSAVSWNAAVSCVGGPGVYEDCPASDLGVDGLPGSPEAAVMHPVSRYVQLLRTIDANKRAVVGRDEQRVFTAAVAGVPQGYVDGQDLVFQDAVDPAFQAAFGIGPGCHSTSGRGTPPARVREVVAEFEEFNREMVSVCSSDWVPALACVPGFQDTPRGCVEGCVADTDPTTEVLDASCRVELDVGGERTPVAPCLMLCNGGVCPPGREHEADDWIFPDGAEVCYRLLLDDWQPETPSTLDNIGPECLDDGHNLQIALERSEPQWVGQCLSVTCEASMRPEVDCPGL